MPYQVGDVIRIINGGGPQGSPDIHEYTIKCVHDHGYHILDISQIYSNGFGDICPSRNYHYLVCEDNIRLVNQLNPIIANPSIPYPFKIGDRVRRKQEFGNIDYEFTIAIIELNYNGGENGGAIWDSTKTMGLYTSHAELVFNYILGEIGKITINPKFTIGSDIECSFVYKGQQVSNDIAMDDSFREFAEFGTDHGGRVGEFRAKFAGDPREHCYNLKKAISKVINGGKMLPESRLDSSHIIGSDVVGGHIHFGIKDRFLQKKIKMNLDYWLLPTIQPLFPKSVFMKRVESGYGKLDTQDVRQQPHGFEYRPIPSFIFNEQIAKGIFCLAYAIVQLTLEGKLKIRMEEQDAKWVQNFIDDYNNYGLNNLHDVRQESIKKLLDKNLLKGLYKDIVPLFDAIHQEKQFSGDIAEGWGMQYKYVLNSGDKKKTSPH